MSERFEDLPIEIRKRVFSFTRELEDGSVEVADTKGLLEFVFSNAEAYPALLNLLQVDEERLTQHIQDTGEVPPGVKLIQTSQVEGQNITQVRITHGPASVPKETLGDHYDRKKTD